MTLVALLRTLRTTTPAEAPELIVGPAVPPADRIALMEAMARQGSEDPGVSWALALVQRKASVRGSLDRRQKLQALLDGLHGLAEYRDDPPGELDYYGRVQWTLTPREDTRVSPLSGLRRGSGDCEDLAMAFCAFAMVVGIPARCVWLPQPNSPQNHVAAVSCDLPEGCVWVETTLPGARVGEHPYDAYRRLGGGRQDLEGHP
jgi:hypothetical protein